MDDLQRVNLLAVLALASVVPVMSGSVFPEPLLTGPDKAYVGSKVVFRCISPGLSPPVNYKLMRDGHHMIATHIDLHGKHPATFSFKAAQASEGTYVCKARKGEMTKVSNIIRLIVVIPVSGTRVTPERVPPVAFEGSQFTLSCDVAEGSHLSYTWTFDRKDVTFSTSPLFHQVGNKLVLERVTPEHAGNYSCLAGSRLLDISRFSSSGEIQVIVKANVSTPRVSFTISKDGADYSGNVTCWSSRGSLPVNFSLSLDGKDVRTVTATRSLFAWFPVDLMPGQDMGVVRCRVKNEAQDLMSEPLTLEVVPVGGHANIELEYLYAADSKMATARLRCHISMGTFPFFSWLLNDSVLPSDNGLDAPLNSDLHRFVLADRRRTLIISELGPEESGYYRCRARDSYDDTTHWVESAAVLVRATESRPPCPEPLPSPCTATTPQVAVTTTEVIAIAFCCFLLVALSVGVGCVYKMLDQSRGQSHGGAANPNAEPSSPSSPTSHAGIKQANTSRVVTAVLNQTIEITV